MRMYNISRRNVSSGALNASKDYKPVALQGGVVPGKFLDTPRRVLVRRVLRVVGFYSFIMTVLLMLLFLSCVVFPGLIHDDYEELFLFAILGSFFLNHMGLLIEMGGDGVGVNWFARGAGVIWLSLCSCGVIGILVKLVGSFFG